MVLRGTADGLCMFVDFYSEDNTKADALQFERWLAVSGEK